MRCFDNTKKKSHKCEPIVIFWLFDLELDINNLAVCFLIVKIKVDLFFWKNKFAYLHSLCEMLKFVYKTDNVLLNIRMSIK